MTEFTPFAALAGGALIGFAAVLMMAVNGRIAGVSGIVDGVMAPMREGFRWKLAFITGLITAPLFYAFAVGARPDVSYPHGIFLIAAGGFLVGFGSRLGSGCTSGHGVCGIARLSRRSFAATGVFMAAAIVTVLLVNLFGSL